ncbi:MAG: hypothetical protein ACP5NV_02625 [Candidatus Woesearchaeota archaeon]
MRKTSKLKRKGITSEYLISTILGVIILVLLIIVIDKFYNNYKEKAEIQDCRTSIGAHSALAKSSYSEVFTDIKCQTRNLKIDAKKHNDAKRAIAEDMRRCWYEWQNGNAQLFEGEGIFCHVCSVYDFKQKNQKIEGFQQFLLEEKIKIRSSVYPEDTESIEYMKYFTEYKTSKTEDIEEYPNKTAFKETMIIDTSKKYATIFVYASGKEDMQKFLEGGYRQTALIGGGTAVGLGALAFVAGGPPGWVIGGILVGGLIIWQALTYEEPQWMSIIQFMEYNSTQISELGCQYLEANQVSHSQQ